jgi:small subunit ribosomal protein S5
MVKAAFEALANTQSPRQVAARRGLKVPEVLGRRGSKADAADAASSAE